MSEKILYQKEYPQLPWSDDHFSEEPQKTADQNGADFIKRTLENIVYVLLPEREDGKLRFIEDCIRVSSFHEMDIVIREYTERISTTLCVDCYVNFPGLKVLIALSDEMCFECKGERVLLKLDYYTHAVFLYGRKMAPL